MAVYQPRFGGDFGRIGNTELVDYGIFNEGSDLRIHVCFQAEMICIFSTKTAQQLAGSGKYELKIVKTDGLVTAKGWAIPVSHFHGLKSVGIPNRIMEKHKVPASASTSRKGQAAMRIVIEMMNNSDLPVPLVAREVDDAASQIKGIDLSLHTDCVIQVKCDYVGGNAGAGGTGNLFIQKSECNPNQQH